MNRASIITKKDRPIEQNPPLWDPAKEALKYWHGHRILKAKYEARDMKIHVDH